MNKLVKNVEKILSTICVIGILIGIVIITCSFHKNEDGIVNFNKLFFIEAFYDEKELGIKKGDLLFIEKDSLREYHINNIIAYYTADKNANITIRVKKVIDGYSDNSNSSYIFMVEDDNDKTKHLTISGIDVIGKWNFNKISGGARIFNFLISRYGFFTFMIIPLIILFIFEFIMLLYDYKHRSVI